MIRHFAGYSIAAFLLTLITAGVPRPTAAQTARQTTAGQQQTPAASDERAAQQQEQVLDQVLTAWFNSSREIRRLEGEHRRFVFDFVFNVQKQSAGRFYYEAPDKGRIDLTPVQVKAGTEEEKVHPATREKHMLKVQPDSAERWVCDGQQILVVDDVRKHVQQFNIPRELQGGNIMDGPLPFLFGMPPEKAKARYDMQVLNTQGGAIDLLARPRLAQDAANYKWARIRIEQKTMLPMAVQLLDPAGTRETVYTFPRITKNPNEGLFSRLKWWKDRDPFKPDLKGYDLQAATTAPMTRDGSQPDGSVTVPSVIGFDYQQAQKLLERAGFTVKFRKGEPAVAAPLVHHVQSQIPKPREAATDGATVWLTLYMPMVAQTAGDSSEGSTTSSKPATGDVESIKLPRVTGLFWKDAEKILRNLGCIPEFVQGQPAGRTSDTFVAYEQSPPAGTVVEKGQKVTLKLFIKPTE